MNLNAARTFAGRLLSSEDPPPERITAVAISAATALPDLERCAYGRCDGMPAAVGLAQGRLYGLRVLDREEQACEAWSWDADLVAVAVTDTFTRISRRHPYADSFDASLRRTWSFSSGDRVVEATVEFDWED